ncbi:MAG: hypothetical protein ACI837_002182 [Crocinitomicaceae bacterium]|jgi:hypothetical protein
MKRLRKFLPILLIPMIAACGGGDDAVDGEGGEIGENGTEAKAPNADIAELAGKSSLTNVEFNRVVNFINDQEVTLTGFPYIYPSAEDVEFKPNSTGMIDGIDNSVKNIEVRLQFKGDPEVRTMKAGELFAVKGTLEVSHSVSEYGSTTRVTLKEAEFVDGATAKSGDMKTIADLDPSKQIFCGDLYSIMHEHYLGLAKKKITISGAYVSTTISKSQEGEIREIRVDLGDSDNKVGCEMVAEPNGDDLNAKRSAGKDVAIEGTYSGIVFGNPRISGGVLK